MARLQAAVGALLLLAVSAAGCQAHDTATRPASSTAGGPSIPTPNNGFADEQQVRDLYRGLVSAMGRFDVTEQVRLTCAKYKADLQRRADSDPILRIDFFGSPDQMRRLGLDAATDKLQAALLPASREAVQAVVKAVIDGDEPQYRTAIHRVEQEGSTATMDRFDRIDINGDTATVQGAFTLNLFSRPPKLVEGTNQAVRENGQWRDCTPARQQR